jgi:hypothetical protein
MKRPKKGVRSRSTGTKTAKKSDPTSGAPVQDTVPQIIPPVLPTFVEPPSYQGPAYCAHHRANLIPNDESIANGFCFGAFANKISGVVYNNLTGNFQFMSIGGSVCFFVMYHYTFCSDQSQPLPKQYKYQVETILEPM